MLQNQKEPAKLITLLELFDGRKFEVPDYQRGYSWDEEQVLDLLTDIEMHNSKSGHKHFTGTIVVERPNGGNNYQIVDGQQRLVTCVMILRAIVELNPRKLKGLESILTKTKSGFETSITLGEQDDRYFNRSVLNVSRVRIKTASNRRLKEGYSAIFDWVKRNKTKLNDILQTLISGFGFIFFETVSDKETTAMFEVINNRGKELSELEKFKNIFLHVSLSNTFDEINLTKNIRTTWIGILENLELAGVESVHEENRFVSYAFSLLFRQQMEESDSEYNWFRRRAYEAILNSKKPKNKLDHTTLDELVYEINNYVNFLLSASFTYAFLFNRDGFFRQSGGEYFTEELDNIFKEIRNHGSISNIIPLVLSLMDLYYKLPAKRSRITRILRTVTILNFRVFCLPTVVRRTDAKKSVMLNYASAIYEGSLLDGKVRFNEEYMEEISRDDYYEWIDKTLITLIQNSCPEEKFVKALTLDFDESYNFFTWNTLNFFLAKYELFLRKDDKSWDFESILYSDSENEKLSKEHVLAQQNKDLFPKHDNVEKRRIGNFILLSQSLNQKLGTKNVETKVKYLAEKLPGEKCLMHVTELVQSFGKIQNEILTGRHKNKNRQKEIIKSVFDLRETKMIKFALKEWAYPGEPEFKFEKVDTLEAERKKLSTRYFFRD